MIALIINFNRVTLMKNLADWLFQHDCEPIIIDNNSDYPPLLEYYSNGKYTVVRMNKNCGHKVIWEQEILKLLNVQGRYIVTDSDLDLSGIPSDWMKVLNEGLDKYKNYDKCGFSLEINDVSKRPVMQEMINKCELRYWKKPLDNLYFEAGIDTTFAMYRQAVDYYTLNGIRTNRPYTAKHVPWYYDKLKDLPEDERYYFEHANESSSGKFRIT